MLITRTSIYSGKTRTLDLDVTKEQMAEFESPNRRAIQYIFPNLSANDREFILNGVTKEEWEELYGKDDDIDSERPDEYTDDDMRSDEDDGIIPPPMDEDE